MAKKSQNNKELDKPTTKKDKLNNDKKNKKPAKEKIKSKPKTLLSKPVRLPIWLSVSECAKIGGITTKTIRRAIQTHKISYKIVKNRYLVELSIIIKYLNLNKKLKNKLKEKGIEQYIIEWRE